MSRTGQMSSSPPSTALDRFRPRERDRLALGATARERRQPPQDEISIGDRLPPDLVKRVGHRAGPMWRQQQALDLARRLVARRGLLRKDVGRCAKPAALDLPPKFGGIHPG